MANSINFNMQHQLQNEWCWAATSASVAQYYDPASAWTQCAIVNNQLGQTTCCADGSTPQCNQSWFLDQALTAVGHFAWVLFGAQVLASIMQEINAGRPLCVRVGWNGGGGHFLAISGYDDTPGNETVLVSDPWYGVSIVSYAVFVSAYQGVGSWTHSYFTR